MLGWAFLLVWADRKPVERKGVLLLTVIPVSVGMAVPGLYAVISGFAAAEVMAGTWLLEAAIVGLFVVAYFNARGMERE